MNSNHMKKCTPDIITSIVLLGFLLTLTVQIGAIPKDSATYPKILMALSYTMVTARPPRQIRRFIGCITFDKPIKIFDMINTSDYRLSEIQLPLAALKLKNKAVIIILPVVLTLAIYFLFSLFLSVILPRGSWISLNL